MRIESWVKQKLMKIQVMKQKRGNIMNEYKAKPREERIKKPRKRKEPVQLKKDEKIEDIELERRKWRNRRKMAWFALISMIVLMFVLLYGNISESRINTLKEPITWFYFSMASVIGAYMGFTTYASIKGK